MSGKRFKRGGRGLQKPSHPLRVGMCNCCREGWKVICSDIVMRILSSDRKENVVPLISVHVCVCVCVCVCRIIYGLQTD